MATIRQYTPNDFQATSQPIVEAPTAIDFSPIVQLGQALRQKQQKEEYDAGVIEGQNAQVAAGDKTLVTKDADGFFDSFSAKGFQKGAEAAFSLKKQAGLKAKTIELETKYQYDPEGFTKAFDAYKEEYLTGLPAEHSADIFLAADDLSLGAKSRIDQNVIQKGREDQQFTLAQKASEIAGRIQIEVERDGMVSPETQAAMGALQDSMDSAEMSNAFKLSTQDAWKAATIQSNAIHAYKNATDKGSVESAILNGTGEWEGVSFEDRQKALQGIAVFSRKEDANTTARNKVLGREIDAALDVSKSGNQPQNTEALIQRAVDSGDIDLIDKAQKLAAQEGVRGNVELYKTMGLDSMTDTQAAIDAAANAAGGYTPALVAAKEALAKKRGELEAAQKQDDMLAYGMANDTTPDEQIDATGRLLDPDTRALQVERTRALYGADTNFYTQAELNQYKQTWEAGDLVSRKAMISAIVEQTPPDELNRVVSAIAPKNAELAVVMSAVENGRHDIADAIVEGADAQKNMPDLYKGEDWTNAKAYTTVAVQGLFPLDKTGATVKPVADAVTNLIASDVRAGRVTTADINDSYVEKATARLFGVAELPTMNGQKFIPFEAGMTPDQHETILDNLSADPTAAANLLKSMSSNGTLPRDMMGQYGTDIDAQDVFERGKLVYVGPNKYYIAMPRSQDEIDMGADNDLILRDAGTGRPFVFDYDKIKNPPRQEAMKPEDLARAQDNPFRTAIGQRESGNDYTAVNSFGYSGKYQFGAQALADVGLIDPKKYAAAKNAGKNNKQILADASNWTIAGGQQAFLKAPDLQEKAYTDYTRRNIDALHDLGVITADTDPSDAAGYLAVAHLLGPKGALAFKNGVNGSDGYGTKASTYFAMGKKAVTKE
ncbi:hypothetical protein [Dongia sp.]|uniref:hypothetical protein n=1 Tax=Dongia sp. TaxID=1977262 RepID=UPI0035AD8E53